MEIGGDSEMGVELSLMSLGGQVLFHYNLLHLTLDNCGDSAYHHLIHNYNAVVSLGFLFRHHWTDIVPTHQAAYDVDFPIFSFHLEEDLSVKILMRTLKVHENLTWTSITSSTV